jgi:hypothetical protein
LDLKTHSSSIKENIMKASIVFATGLILAAGTVVGSINVAHAGAAGTAGSISATFTETGNVLTGTAGAVAVGKSIAITTTTATFGGDITAVAIGSAGKIDTVNFNSADVKYTGGEDTKLKTGQANDFDAKLPSSTNLNGKDAGLTLQ